MNDKNAEEKKAFCQTFSSTDYLEFSKDIRRFAAQIMRKSERMMIKADKLYEGAEMLSIHNEGTARLGIDPFSFVGNLENNLFSMRKVLHEEENLFLKMAKDYGKVQKEEELSYARRYLSSSGLYRFFYDSFSGLVIKTPMLMPRLSPLAGKEDNYGRLSGSSRNFLEETEILIREKIMSEELSSFAEKTISFLFCYPQDYPFVLDSDSHETKPLIDAITRFLPGGDSGETTSVFYQTYITQEEEPFTLITLRKGLSAIPSHEELLLLIEKLKTEQDYPM